MQFPLLDTKNDVILYQNLFDVLHQNNQNFDLLQIARLHDAIYCAKICAYAQGFQLMKLAEKEHGWELDFASIAKKNVPR